MVSVQSTLELSELAMVSILFPIYIYIYIYIHTHNGSNDNVIKYMYDLLNTRQLSNHNNYVSS